MPSTKSSTPTRPPRAVERTLSHVDAHFAEPLMYLSGDLKQHQAEYYRRLSAIRTDGDWEG